MVRFHDLDLFHDVGGQGGSSLLCHPLQPFVSHGYENQYPSGEVRPNVFRDHAPDECRAVLVAVGPYDSGRLALAKLVDEVVVLVSSIPNLRRLRQIAPFEDMIDAIGGDHIERV